MPWFKMIMEAPLIPLSPIEKAMETLKRHEICPRHGLPGEWLYPISSYPARFNELSCEKCIEQRNKELTEQMLLAAIEREKEIAEAKRILGFS